MNLVEARLDGAAVEFGGHRIPLRPEHLPETTSERIVLGIRPESFEDASFADPSLPQLDVEVAVLEDLGSDAHVLFQVDATPVHTDEHRRDDEEETLIAGDGDVFTARVDAATQAQPGRGSGSPSIRPAFTTSIAKRARTGVAEQHSSAPSESCSIFLANPPQFHQFVADDTIRCVGFYFSPAPSRPSPLPPHCPQPRTRCRSR